MKSVYDPTNLANVKSEDEDYTAYYASMDDFIEEKEDGLFHVGQLYEDKEAKTLYCKHCGGKEFNIGQGSYFTAAKCVNCNYEICIHEG